MRSPDRRGLTLVEVLLALAIIGMGAAVLTTAASRCLAMVTVCKNYQQARYALELADIKYPLVVNEDGELQNQDVSDAVILPGFSFSRASTSDGDYEDTGLFIVRNRITWEGSGSNNFEETVRYLYFTNDLAPGGLSP